MVNPGIEVRFTADEAHSDADIRTLVDAAHELAQRCSTTPTSMVASARPAGRDAYEPFSGVHCD
jgi:hypothetical protein